MEDRLSIIATTFALDNGDVGALVPPEFGLEPGMTIAWEKLADGEAIGKIVDRATSEMNSNPSP